MPIAPSFADTFQPRRQSTVGSPSPLPLGLGSGATSDLARDLRLTREQARHCRLWNFIAIDANAQKAAEDTPHVGYLVDGERVADPGHPLARLFAYCNEVDFWQGLAYEIFLQFGLFRRVVLWAVPDGLGLPAELWVIPTPWAEAKTDRDGVARRWTITPGGGVPFDVGADEIVCIQGKHPTSKSVPLSPTEAGAEWILSSEIIERARHQTYEHGPLQSMLIEIDKEVHHSVTPELLDAIGEKFMARYRGFAQAGRPIVQPPGVKAVPWSVKPNEMLTGEQADQLRDNVLALHKVPRFAVGIAHDLNRATAEVSERVWYNTAINPMRRYIAGALTEHLAKRFDPDLQVWFEDLVPDDAEARRLDFAADAKEGIASLDELRVQRNYAPLGTPEARQPILLTRVASPPVAPADRRDETEQGTNALTD